MGNYKKNRELTMEMHNDSIVKVDRCTGLICLLLNILICGSGTILAGCLAHNSDRRIKMNNVIVGTFQLVLFPYVLLGWFWSIYTGYLLYERSSGSWMGFKRVEYLSEEEKREQRAKERIKQFVR